MIHEWRERRNAVRDERLLADTYVCGNGVRLNRFCLCVTVFLSFTVEHILFDAINPTSSPFKVLNTNPFSFLNELNQKYNSVLVPINLYVCLCSL